MLKRLNGGKKAWYTELNLENPSLLKAVSYKPYLSLLVCRAMSWKQTRPA